MSRSLRMIVLLLIGQSLFGQIPQTISYQGVIHEADGITLITDPNRDMRFLLYDEINAGTLVWGPETHAASLSGAIAVQNGRFTVILGKLVTLSTVPFDQAYYLEIEIFDAGAWIAFSPRTELTASPYALAAANVDSVEYAFTSGNVLGDRNVFPSQGYVGINTQDPLVNLQINAGPGDGILIADSATALTALELRLTALNLVGFGGQLSLFPEGATTLADASLRLRGYGVDNATGNTLNAAGTQAFFRGGNVAFGTTIANARVQIGQVEGDIAGNQLQLQNSQVGGETFSISVGGDGAAANGIVPDGGFAISNMTNATPDFTISSNGNVGIGTTTPIARVEVSSSSVLNGQFYGLTDIDTGQRWWTGILPDRSYYIYDDTGNITRMVLTPTGNVGIGTTTPIARMEVSSNSASNGQFYGLTDTNTGRRWMLGVLQTGGFYIFDDVAQTTAFSVSTSGNVGIGATTANAKLDVNGGLIVTGTATANAFALTTNAARYYSIPGSAFKSQTSTAAVIDSASQSAYSFSTGVWNWFSAPVHLPHGAKIDTVFMTYKDNATPGFGSDDDIVMELIETSQNGTTSVLGSRFTSSVESAFPQTVTWYYSNTVDNRQHSYLVKVGWRFTDNDFVYTDLSVYQVVIAYSISSPLP